MQIPQVHIISLRKSRALHVCMYFSSQVRSLFWAQNLFCSIELMCSELSLWLVALETRTVLFRCEEKEREREMMMAWRRGKVGDGLYREKQKKENKWKQTGCGRRGLGYLLSTPLSTSFTVSPSISLSLFLFSRTIPSLSLSAEGEGWRGGCKCERNRERGVRKEWTRHTRLFDNRSSLHFLSVGGISWVNHLTLFVWVWVCVCAWVHILSELS